MTDGAARNGYGELIEPATVRIQRLLPGPVELVRRNYELSDPPGERPPGFPAEHRMPVTVTACQQRIPN